MALKHIFMLETFAKLEQLISSRGISLHQDDHSLLWLARDTVQSSPILFLDEF
jgi:protein AFG1